MWIVEYSDLSPGKFGGVSHLTQGGHDPIAMIALDFDLAVANRAAGSADGFELFQELVEVVGSRVESRDGSHKLPAASSFSTYAYRLVFREQHLPIGVARAAAPIERSFAHLARNWSFQRCPGKES